ncbi:hypothetical protein K250101E9_10890 [Enterocloster aldenensis]
MYFITTKRMLEVCFSAHPNIQYRTDWKTDRRESHCLFFYCLGYNGIALTGGGIVKKFQTIYSERNNYYID